LSEKQTKEILQYLMSGYPDSHRLTDISSSVEMSDIDTLTILNRLIEKDSIRIESIPIINQKSRNDISKRIRSSRKTIAGIMKQKRASTSQRRYLAVVNNELTRLINERDTLTELISYYVIVPKFKHYTVVGTTDTFDKYNTLRVSCTLDYSTLVDLEKHYYMLAVYKILDWFTEMFNSRDVKTSSEESITLKEVTTKLTLYQQDVTSIAYDWWWDRSGTSSNNEEKVGVIDWSESIPLGEAGGWFTPGKKGMR